MSTCIFCQEVVVTIDATCTLCSICPQCQADYISSDQLLLCECNQVIIAPRLEADSIPNISYEAISQLVTQFTTLAAKLQQDITRYQQMLDAYNQHIFTLRHTIEDYMPVAYVNAPHREEAHFAAVQARCDTLLAELASLNGANHKNLILHIDNVTVCHHMVQRGFHEATVAMTQPFTSMLAWYAKWYGQIELVTKTLDIDSYQPITFYQVYFYRELSPVNIDTIGFIGLPYSAATGNGVNCEPVGDEDERLSVMLNYERHGRQQVIKPSLISNEWYHYGTSYQIAN